jgi:hypothetical protein
MGSEQCWIVFLQVYKKFVLVYDDAKCWPIENAIPIFANKGTSDQQMVACRDTVHHLLSAKPAGSYLKQPYEVRDAVLARKIMFNCGNNVKGSKPSSSNPGYPMLGKATEGGGGTWAEPWTYGELTGACKHKAGDAANPDLSSMFASSGTRYGGTVFTEETRQTLTLSAASNSPL